MSTKAFPRGILAQVISLPRRQDRRDLFEVMAKEQGIEYVFQPGVSEFAIPAKNISEAHRACVLRSKMAGAPLALIMEDDCWFPAADGYAHYLRNMPADFDLYLGGAYGAAEDEHGVTWSFCGLHCYVVHARFYDTFLGVDPLDHIDHALRGLGRYVVCQPYAAIQRSGYSDNTGTTADYGNVVSKRIYQG